MFADRFKNRLTVQHQNGLFRSPVTIDRRDGKYIIAGGCRLINFSSNDYLGLGASIELRKKAADNFLKYGTTSGSSRLVSGNYSLISTAEKEYARYFGYDDAVFFSSGYQANLGLISTLFEKNDAIIFDKHLHASSVKGISLSGADFFGYNHNRMSHLEKRLKNNANGNTAVITESLFSMDGDLLDVAGLTALKKKHDFFTVIDEAHAFGVLGDGGQGMGHGVADVAIGTFGKAFGLFGAFVLLPEPVKAYLFNFSSPLIYSTTLPKAHAATTLDALNLIEKSDDKRNHVRQISIYMKKQLERAGFEVDGDAHILSVLIGDAARSGQVSANLMDKGFYLFPARYPTVPIGRAILRISLTALHTEEDVNAVVQALKEEF